MWVLSGAAERCLLSLLLLGAGLAVVEPLAGVCFCASSCGSCGFPRRVLPQVILRGFRYLFWLLLPVLLLRWSSVCWVCGVLGKALGFPPCALLFFRGLWFGAGYPSELLPFLTPYTWLRWWRKLGCNPSLVFSVLLLRRMACRGSLGSAPCVRELPWGL